MSSLTPRFRRGRRALIAMIALLGLLVPGAPALAAAAVDMSVDAATVADPPEDWPEFGYQGVAIDKPRMSYNPTNEFIFPTVFHAGDHLADPLGEWYLYAAPHDDPGGIVLLYSDSLEGPWAEFDGNPVISRTWEPYYDLSDGPPGNSHVSSPDVVWNPDEQKMFLYYHGNNSVIRYATSDDGVTFEYGGVAVADEMGDTPDLPTITASSYARVFPHPDPDSPYEWAMFYMTNDDTPVDEGLRGVRRIRLAESTDGRNWIVAPEPVVEPGDEEGANVSGPNLWELNGQLYVLYHGSSGKSYARSIDRTLRNVGETPIVLHQSSGVGADTGRVAAPEIVEDGGERYLFYESGDRLGATIAWAKDGAEPITEIPPVGDFPTPEEDPLFVQCAVDGSDEFDGGLTDGVWDRVVREASARHRVEDGALVVPTYQGGITGASLLQQELPDGQWQVTTKVEYPDGGPSLNYQQAGLMLYGSDSEYARFTLGKMGPGRGIELAAVGSLRFTDQAISGHGDRTKAWLRLTSDGYEIVAELSTDGVTFEEFGRRIPARIDGEQRYTHIGPYAYRGNAAVELEPRFDWIRFSPSIAEYETCAAPDSEAPAWEPGAVYTDGDRVTHEGAVYVAQWWTTETPGASVWGSWMEQGTLQTCAVGDVAEWTASQVYTGGETVVFDGEVFEAEWWTRNQQPGGPSGPWRSRGSC